MFSHNRVDCLARIAPIVIPGNQHLSVYAIILLSEVNTHAK